MEKKEKVEDEEVGRSCDCTLRDHPQSMVQAVIFDVCAKTTVNAALKHISNRFKILENI